MNDNLQEELIKDLLLESHEGLERFDKVLAKLKQLQEVPVAPAAAPARAPTPVAPAAFGLFEDEAPDPAVAPALPVSAAPPAPVHAPEATAEGSTGSQHPPWPPSP